MDDQVKMNEEYRVLRDLVDRYRLQNQALRSSVDQLNVDILHVSEGIRSIKAIIEKGRVRDDAC